MGCAICGAITVNLGWLCRACELAGFRTPKLVIGVCGRARHGKDSIATTIRQHFESRGLRCFQSSISTIVFEYAVSHALINADTREHCNRDELNTLVDVGHQMRGIDEDYWITRLARRIIEAQAIIAVIPGIRFPNEINWIKQASGLMLRIKRLNQNGSMFISPDRDANDVMESCLDYVIPDFEITVKTRQENWRDAQAKGFAIYAEHEKREVLVQQRKETMRRSDEHSV